MKELRHTVSVGTLLLCTAVTTAAAQDAPLHVTDAGVLERRGLEVLVYNNMYSPWFGDEKISGIELIHHGLRTATDGDVRLSNTPEQWDPTSRLGDREIDRTTNTVHASLSYPDFDFQYRVDVRPAGDGVLVTVHLDDPLPEAVAGRAGFNLDFLPSAYFGKTFMMDGRGDAFPRAAGGAMYRDSLTGTYQAAPIATGTTLVLAPEDAERRITITAHDGTLSLYDARNKAQNGWYVVRGMLPPGKTGDVLEWTVTPNILPGWVRQPVIAHSQVGYHPDQKKVAVLETDPNDRGLDTLRLLRLSADGTLVPRLAKVPTPWGRYIRYDYAKFDFSDVTEPGLYVLEYRGERTAPFRIAADVYEGRLWQSTLDTYLAEQMDHVLVTDRYRVWHGVSHLDDARQAPPNHQHFDGYRQGPNLDSPFQPGEHIPGLNVGGWFDAGDFDLLGPSQASVITNLSLAYEAFGIDWDETTVREPERYVALRQPDGVPDIIQQVTHGVMLLLAQYRIFGHAIPGIIAPTLDQYTHLGDAASKTDGYIYKAALDSFEIQGQYSGMPDDRWAFTGRSSGLDYGAIGALAAASRVLRGFDDTLADSCLDVAVRGWNDEHSRPPSEFRSFNTTGGRTEAAEMGAAVELLLATKGGTPYATRLTELLPTIERGFFGLGPTAVRALPYMDADYRARLEAATRDYEARLDSTENENPFGVPIGRGRWAGSGGVIGFAMRNYMLHRAFPEIIGRDAVVRALEFLYGTHPVADISMVAGVGTRSLTLGYGNNRADFTFIPGGVVPGVLIVQPDYPEEKLDWPFLWYENEYTIGNAASYIYAANAVRSLFE